jgi:hypothetical protein
MSDWKERSNKRRDERNIKISDESVKHSSKKDKKKWCKGKVGTEHTPICMPYSKYTGFKAFTDCRELVCTNCGKILDTYLPFSLVINKDKPDWVIDE